MKNVHAMVWAIAGCAFGGLGYGGETQAQGLVNLEPLQGVPGLIRGPSLASQSQSLYSRKSSAGEIDLGVQARTQWSDLPTVFPPLVNAASRLSARLEPGAYVSYQLIPQRLGVHSRVKLLSGGDARGIAFEMQLASRFELNETTHLGLSASTRWLNGRAGRQLAGQMTGVQALYTVDNLSYALRDMDAGISLSGSLQDRWSYSAGANLGRLFSDPRTSSLLGNGGLGSGRTGLVFFNANYAF